MREGKGERARRKAGSRCMGKREGVGENRDESKTEARREERGCIKRRTKIKKSGDLGRVGGENLRQAT